jgi:hypothetical protein
VREQASIGREIPDLQRLVMRRRDHAQPVRRHRALSHDVGVAFQGGERAAALQAHTLSVLSPDAETTRWPSGVTAHALTQAAWPFSMASARPLSASSSRSSPTCGVRRGHHRRRRDQRPPRARRPAAVQVRRAPGPRPPPPPPSRCGSSSSAFAIAAVMPVAAALGEQPELLGDVAGEHRAACSGRAGRQRHRRRDRRAAHRAGPGRGRPHAHRRRAGPVRAPPPRCAGDATTATSARSPASSTWFAGSPSPPTTASAPSSWATSSTSATVSAPPRSPPPARGRMGAC